VFRDLNKVEIPKRPRDGDRCFGILDLFGPRGCGDSILNLLQDRNIGKDRNPETSARASHDITGVGLRRNL